MTKIIKQTSKNKNSKAYSINFRTKHLADATLGDISTCYESCATNTFVSRSNEVKSNKYIAKPTQAFFRPTSFARLISYTHVGPLLVKNNNIAARRGVFFMTRDGNWVELPVVQKTPDAETMRRIQSLSTTAGGVFAKAAVSHGSALPLAGKTAAAATAAFIIVAASAKAATIEKSSWSQNALQGPLAGYRGKWRNIGRPSVEITTERLPDNAPLSPGNGFCASPIEDFQPSLLDSFMGSLDLDVLRDNLHTLMCLVGTYIGSVPQLLTLFAAITSTVCIAVFYKQIMTKIIKQAIKNKSSKAYSINETQCPADATLGGVNTCYEPCVTNIRTGRGNEVKSNKYIAKPMQAFFRPTSFARLISYTHVGPLLVKNNNIAARRGVFFMTRDGNWVELPVMQKTPDAETMRRIQSLSTTAGGVFAKAAVSHGSALPLAGKTAAAATAAFIIVAASAKAATIEKSSWSQNALQGPLAGYRGKWRNIGRPSVEITTERLPDNAPLSPGNGFCASPIEDFRPSLLDSFMGSLDLDVLRDNLDTLMPLAGTCIGGASVTYGIYCYYIACVYSSTRTVADRRRFIKMMRSLRVRLDSYRPKYANAVFVVGSLIYLRYLVVVVGFSYFCSPTITVTMFLAYFSHFLDLPMLSHDDVFAELYNLKRAVGLNAKEIYDVLTEWVASGDEMQPPESSTQDQRYSKYRGFGASLWSLSLFGTFLSIPQLYSYIMLRRFSPAIEALRICAATSPTPLEYIPKYGRMMNPAAYVLDCEMKGELIFQAKQAFTTDGWLFPWIYIPETKAESYVDDWFWYVLYIIDKFGGGDIFLI